MPKRKCTFNSDLQNKYPMLKRGKHDWEVVCTICSTNISIANKGVSDINDHLNTQKHKSNSKGQASSSNISTFFAKTRPSSEENLIRAAEGAMAYHIVSHHMSFNSLDCSNSLNRVLFSESNTAKNLTCNRTKATAIVNNVLSPLSIADIKSDLQDVEFISVSTDASNHGSTKMFPIVIQYFDKKKGITSKLLEIECTENETSDTIVDIILKQLREHGLLSKCVAFSGDNCNTNFGGNSRAGTNNVFHKLKGKLNPYIVGVGCSAHILHNAVHHGCDQLPIDVELMILKIYNFFSIYTVRTEALKDFCTVAETEYKQLLFHSKTRWLSLFPAIERLLKMYKPLNDYFESVDRPPVLIKKFFEDPLSEAYLFLIHSVMHVFHGKIEKLEKCDNSVIETRNILTSLKKTLEDRIKENFVPLKVQSILNKQDHEDTKTEFKKNSIGFYSDMKSYIEKWEKPLQDFDKFNWMILPTITESTPWAVVAETVEFLKEINIEIDDTKMIDEWVNLKAFSMTLSDEDKLLSANQLWIKFFKTPNAFVYTEMLKIAQYFFCIPAHNANVERIFSLVTQQWTKERNALSAQTVSSLIKIKYNFKDYSCVDFYKFLLEKNDVLAQIGKTDKYQNNEKKT